MPLDPIEVLRRHLAPWAYDYFTSSVYVNHANVGFIRQKMTECGNPDFRVHARAGSTAALATS